MDPPVPVIFSVLNLGAPHCSRPCLCNFAFVFADPFMYACMPECVCAYIHTCVYVLTHARVCMCLRLRGAW